MHWNYFLSVEDDLERLSRYIEFRPENYSTFSIELTRIILASTQEVDVLLRQICSSSGNKPGDEAGYRQFILAQYPKLTEIVVEFARNEIKLEPFKDWKVNKTPSWWTANNKIKHFRHTEFKQASLENSLNSVAALFITNIYFYLLMGEKDSDTTSNYLYPNPKLIFSNELIGAITPTAFGNINIYRLP